MDALKKLYIEPSSRCNLHCLMCFRNGWIDGRQECMSGDVWERVVAALPQCRALETVMFAGMGEPLTHPEVVRMVRETAECGLRPELVTNGTLLVPQLADALTAAGLHALWISMDGFARESYEKIQRGAQYDRIVENLRYFAKNKGKCKLCITFVAMRENREELDRINRFADSVGADAINLSLAIPAAPTPAADTLYDSHIPVGRMKRFSPGVAGRIQNVCPFVQDGAAFVRADGTVCPCMQLLHSAYTYLFEEKRKVLACGFGHVLDAPLPEIWQSPAYAALRARVRDFAFPDCTLCDGCDDRTENAADCMFNPFPTCGACLWAQGVARCP